MSFNKTNRKIHYWGAIVCALPVLIIIVSGLFLLLKKDVDWIQPPTKRGTEKVPLISFEKILEVSKTVEEAGIKEWSDVDRLDVRPGKGVVKVRAENRWEIQIDSANGEILHVAYRRSDLIESLHDGSFFHDAAKLWIFLPAALILLVLWISGILLFLVPINAKRRRKKRQAQTNSTHQVSSISS